MIRDSDVEGLRRRFRGALIRPREEGYDEARRVWNGSIDRRPGMIARCAGADDVQEAIRFARDRDLPISVRGGGHSVSGHAVREDGLMIDLSLLKSIRQHVPGAAVIMMTAFGAPEMTSQALLLGVWRVVTKPFEVHEMADLVNQAGLWAPARE